MPGLETVPASSFYSVLILGGNCQAKMGNVKYLVGVLIFDGKVKKGSSP